MSNANTPRFLEWAREIQALAQSGHHYATDDYQRDRCARLMEIAAEMISENTGIDFLPLVKAFSAQTGYATPKIDVRAAVFKDQKLLMVRERLDRRVAHRIQTRTNGAAANRDRTLLVSADSNAIQ